MLRLLFLTLLASILLGYAMGGSLTNLAETRFRWAWVGLVGIILQFLPIEGGLGSAALATSFLLLFAVALVNRRLPGWILILVGLYLNFLVIAVNQGMPVTTEAIRASGQTDTLAELRALDSPKHHLRTAEDELLLLGDIMAVPPPIRQAVSIGDLAAVAGMAWFVFAAMRREPEGATERAPEGLPSVAVSMQTSEVP